MIKAIFQEDRFTLIMPIEKFKLLWDDSYAATGEYDINKYREDLGISANRIDLNSFVAEQLLSILNEKGDEDESANNECFEDYDASCCRIRDVVSGSIMITGRMETF
jgi:hypothetical protein